MILTVLSTPRSGSHYYSDMLGRKHDYIVLHELFLRHCRNLYLYEESDRFILGPYVAGAFYETIENGQLIQIYNKRSDIEQCIDSLFNELLRTNNYIIHEHVSLISDSILNRLIHLSEKIYYIKRDRIEQISSRVIAGHTSVYVNYSGKKICHGSNADNFGQYDKKRFETSIIHDKHLLSYLISAYNMSDSKINNFADIEIVNYEDLHQDSLAPTSKLFPSSFDRLCRDDQKSIIDAIS